MQPKFDLYGWIDRKPVRGIRRSTAKHMVEARSKQALVTTTEVADVTDLVALREKVKKYAEEVKGVKLTYLPFIIKAVVAALKKHPYLNSSMDEEAEDIVFKKYYNIGIAVATEDGLIVPVLKAADQKEVFSLAQEIKDLADSAASRKIDLADLKGRDVLHHQLRDLRRDICNSHSQLSGRGYTGLGTDPGRTMGEGRRGVHKEAAVPFAHL